MNVLFLSLSGIRDIDSRGIYSDLMRKFAQEGHIVYILTPAERRTGMQTHLETPIGNDWHKNVHLLFIKTGNIQKTNKIEKGLSTIEIEFQITRALKRFFTDVKFDLVLYATPPITLVNPINYIKKRDNAKAYLMLKDIFPQNAVDIGMLSKTGLKGILYRHFRKKEKKLYNISNRIGCMSPANVKYVLEHNPEISPDKVEVCPNAIEVQDVTITEEERIALRNKYGLPLDKKIFVYGGNLGKPQDIPFVINCVRECRDINEAFFFIVGDGTEYGKLEEYVKIEKQANLKLMKQLTKEEFDRLIAACDVGLIFLDHRFTIPNFPSRLLSYMQARLPVIACTDSNTDIGDVITEDGFGWWCESNSVASFKRIVQMIAYINDLKQTGDNGQVYLKNHYSVEKVYARIVD